MLGLRNRGLRPDDDAQTDVRQMTGEKIPKGFALSHT